MLLQRLRVGFASEYLPSFMSLWISYLCQCTEMLLKTLNRIKTLIKVTRGENGLQFSTRISNPHKTVYAKLFCLIKTDHFIFILYIVLRFGQSLISRADNSCRIMQNKSLP